LISITHDVEEALLSDEIIVMNEGKIVMKNTPLEVFKHRDALRKIELDIPFVLRLVDALNEQGMKLTGIKSMDELVNTLCQ
jgi:energy-coupling factor transport system ATP-binding protein